MANHIKQFLNNFITADSQKKEWELFLVRNWNEIIGDLQTQVSLEKIAGSTLILGVQNLSWMQELYLLSPILIDNINSKLEKPFVKEVRFKYSPHRKSTLKKEVEKKKIKKSIQLTRKEEKALASINDQKLKEVLFNFLVRCKEEDP